MIPLKDRVIVQTEHQADYQTASGLHVIDEEPQRVIGRVVSVGHVSDVKPDDIVIFSPLCGSRMDHDGDSFLVLREEDILAVVE